MTKHTHYKSNRRYVLRIFALLAGIICITIWFTYYSDYTINYSKSYPRGIWKKTNEPIDNTIKNKFIMFCGNNSAFFYLVRQRQYLQPSMHCDNGLTPLLKKAAGISGDLVTKNHQGTWINGTKLDNSAPLTQDSLSRAMPKVKELTNWEIPNGYFWAISDYSKFSLDSRYYDAIHISQIIAVVEPVLLIDDF